MSILSFPLAAVATALTVLLFAFGVRRLLGLPLSGFRTLLAGLIAFFSASPIILALGGSSVSRSRTTLPGLLFVLLGVVIALLVGMVFLVVSEALVPSGSLPGPLYVLRGLRQQLGRARRYSQITRILVRRGLLPYARGGRRSELATSEGRARLARSLRLALEDGGVTFVKLGQVLSTRRDLIPPEFISELSHLQDDAPQVPWPQIASVLDAELGARAARGTRPAHRGPQHDRRGQRGGRARRRRPGSGAAPAAVRREGAGHGVPGRPAAGRGGPARPGPGGFAGALETGRLSVSVRLLANASDRRHVTGLLHQALLAFLAAAAGIMAVLMIGLHGGPSVTRTVSLYAFFGYCLLVIAAILAVRVLVVVFRPPTYRD